MRLDYHSSVTALVMQQGLAAHSKYPDRASRIARHRLGSP